MGVISFLYKNEKNEAVPLDSKHLLKGTCKKSADNIFFDSFGRERYYFLETILQALRSYLIEYIIPFYKLERKKTVF